MVVTILHSVYDHKRMMAHAISDFATRYEKTHQLARDVQTHPIHIMSSVSWEDGDHRSQFSFRVDGTTYHAIVRKNFMLMRGQEDPALLGYTIKSIIHPVEIVLP